jgi:hypothetical protein
VEAAAGRSKREAVFEWERWFGGEQGHVNQKTQRYDARTDAGIGERAICTFDFASRFVQVHIHPSPHLASMTLSGLIQWI